MGRVVNVSSVHGLRASPFKSVYVTAKHGMEGFSKVVALEGGAKGVTSNCVNPAFVRTPLVESQIADRAKTRGISEDEVIEKVMLQEPAIKRLIEPEEVAELVTYLCAPEASFIDGVSLIMDGPLSVGLVPGILPKLRRTFRGVHEMKREQILELPSMPAASPSYPCGPYRFVQREYLIVAHESDDGAIREAVPEPLEPAPGGVVYYEFIRMPDSSVVPHSTVESSQAA